MQITSFEDDALAHGCINLSIVVHASDLSRLADACRTADTCRNCQLDCDVFGGAVDSSRMILVDPLVDALDAFHRSIALWRTMSSTSILDSQYGHAPCKAKEVLH